MRKFLLSVCMLFLLLLFCFTALANSEKIDIEELECQFSIPSGYEIITRDTPANASVFKDLGVSRTDMMQEFEKNSIYFDAISNTLNEEIVVTMTEINLTNFSVLNETALDVLASTLVSEYSKYGINASKYEIHHHTQANFIKIYFTDTEQTVHGLQYYTVYNGKAMNFTIRSYDGYLSSKQEATIKAVVDSIEFNEAPPVIEQGEDTESFVYSDSESGVSFTVPENWKQEEFTKERDFIDVKFVSTKEEGLVIIFGSIDVWSQMTDEEKEGYTRETLDNSAFSKADMAAVCNTTTNKISIVEYNGREYFKGEMTGSADVYGWELTTTITCLVRIENGWMYMFQFGGRSEHKLYSEFETLLESVEYPVISKTTNTDSEENQEGPIEATKTKTRKTRNVANDGFDGEPNEDFGMIIVVVLLIVVAVVIIIIIFHKKKRQLDETSIYNASVTQEQNNFRQTTACAKCGHRLPIDSTFCHMCGAKIEKE